jgi:molecular chaperone GrpE
MVKKKSHEEGHEELVPENKSSEDQIVTEADTAGPEPSPEEAETIEKTTPEEELNKKLTEMQDKYLRLSAEFDNYRKRTLREKIELVKTGGENVILYLLPVIDDFDRAMISLRETDDASRK